MRVLGKAIDHEYNLFDLLRRPDVSYPDLMGMDGGKRTPKPRWFHVKHWAMRLTACTKP